MKPSFWLALLLILVCCREKQVVPEEFVFPSSPEFEKATKLYPTHPSDSAFVLFSNISETSNDSLLRATAFTYMAIIQSNAGDYFGAQESALAGLHLLDEQNINHRYCFSSLFNELGRSSNSMENYESAVFYYLKAIPLQTDTGYALKLKNNLAVAYRNLGRYTDAISMLEEVARAMDPDDRFYPIVVSNLAHTRWKANPEYYPVPEYLHILQRQQKENDWYGMNGTYKHLSEYYENHSSDSVLFYTRLWLRAAKEFDSAKDRQMALKRLSLLTSSQEAKSYFTQYTELDDSLQRARYNNSNQFAIIRYEAARYKAENLSLSEENAAKALHILRQQIILIASVLLALGVIIWFSRRSRKKRKRIELEAQNAIRESQLKTSQKVHDVVANGLYRIMSEVEHQPELKKEQLLDQIEMLYEKSRDISYDNKASGKQSKDRITELVSAFNTPHTRILLVGVNDIPWQDYAASILQTVETVLQELLVNMAKHSEAKNVAIRFQQKSGELSFLYTDDGKGLPPDFKKGNGIQNTENRILQMGGRIIFTQRQPTGLSVQINLPNPSE